MERKLASIRKISYIQPIEGADAIEVCVVDGWKVVTKKGEFKPGDLCVYCEIDSFLPIKPEFEFLRKTSYKKMSDGSEGFRLKTIRLRKQLSQGMVLPITILEGEDEMKIGVSKQPWGDQLQVGPYDDALVIEVGTDVTDVLGIIKYEPPIPAELSGKVKGSFPSFIPKTDEERVQNISSEYDLFKIQSKHKFYVTEKLDGSSATFYFKDGVFGVCSRNLELLETEGNSFWRVAREMDLENKLKNYSVNYCIQGELIGEGIQGNPYKIKGQTVKFFNAYNIDKQEYLGLNELKDLIFDMELELVPIISEDFILPESINEMILFADGKSVLNNSFDREGVVVRSLDRTISFKAISNQFLLNEK